MIIDLIPDGILSLVPPKVRAHARAKAKAARRKILAKQRAGQSGPSPSPSDATARPPAAADSEIPYWARARPFLTAHALPMGGVPTEAKVSSPQATSTDGPDQAYKPTGREEFAIGLLRSIAPDFEGPIYLIDSSPGNPLGLQCGPHTLGFTQAHLDMTAKPFLQNRSQWKGRGFAAVLDGSHKQYLHTVLHEAAHYVDLKWSQPEALLSEHEFAGNGWPELLAVTRRSPAEGVNAGAKSCSRWHGARWVRAHVHILYRASKVALGLGVNYEREVAGSYYGLSSGAKYALALADEVMGREQESLACILMSQTPAAFNQLWLSDGGDPNQLSI